MLQRLPTEGGEAESEPEREVETQDEGWNRALSFLGSCSSAELTDSALPPEDLLFRLFHEDGVRVFGSQPLRAFCRCSQERIETVLKSFDAAERADMVESDGKIHVTCEYCSKAYAVAPDALEPASAS
jgi:molecular chaperone Hsp33